MNIFFLSIKIEKSDKQGIREGKVSLHLLLRRTNYNPLIQIFYFKTADSEVDFLIKDGTDIKQLIQVTYASSRDEIENREIKVLEKASTLLNCKDLLCVTWDYEDKLKEDEKKIKFIPFLGFSKDLLEFSSLTSQ